jgi:hypothetical protein
MNGTVVFGVCLIGTAAFFLNGGATIPLLIAGVLIAAYGAFSSPNVPRSNAPRRMPTDSDPWV